MATLRVQQGAQYSMVAEFVFSMADVFQATVYPNGTPTTQAMNVSQVITPIPLPVGAVVTGGDVTVETALSGGGVSAATIEVGDSNSAARYLAPTTILAAARTPLVPTGYNGQGENLQLTTAITGGVPTAGQVHVRVHYVIIGRTHETQSV